MAMMACIECGNQVSSEAYPCPHCGKNQHGVKCWACEAITLQSKAVKIMVWEYHPTCLDQFCANILAGCPCCAECGQDLSALLTRDQLLMPRSQTPDFEEVDPGTYGYQELFKLMYLFPKCPSCGYPNVLGGISACMRCGLPIYRRSHNYCEASWKKGGYVYHYPFCSPQMRNPPERPFCVGPDDTVTYQVHEGSFAQGPPSGVETSTPLPPNAEVPGRMPRGGRAAVIIALAGAGVLTLFYGLYYLELQNRKEEPLPGAETPQAHSSEVGPKESPIPGAVPAPEVSGPAEQVRNGLDLKRYCQSRGFSHVTNTDGTGYGWQCMPGGVGIDVQQLCKDQFGPGFSPFLATPAPGGKDDWRCRGH
jgi:hypothetical protein